jgi:hypothetical protein
MLKYLFFCFLALLVSCSSAPIPQPVPERSPVQVTWADGYAYAQVPAGADSSVTGTYWLERDVPDCGGTGPALVLARGAWVREADRFKTLEPARRGDALFYVFSVLDSDAPPLHRYFDYLCVDD